MLPPALLSATPSTLTLDPSVTRAEEATAPIARWLELLREWNARIDLTAARTADELDDLMLADAVLLASLRDDAGPLLMHGARVVDVGAGAGAPGLALALLRPDLRVTLIEPLAKRVSFLRTVIGSLDRMDIALVRGRGEDVAAAQGRAFDVAISRATLPPPAWIPLGLELASSVWALLARDEPPAVSETTIDADVTYGWPRTAATRRAVAYRAVRR